MQGRVRADTPIGDQRRKVPHHTYRPRNQVNFFIPLKTKAKVTTAITATLMYENNTRGEFASVILSDNIEGIWQLPAITAAHQFVSNTGTTAPHNPEENGLAERILSDNYERGQRSADHCTYEALLLGDGCC